MPKYAEKTGVSLDQSLAEIRRTITRYGAAKFGYVQEEDSATIAFEMRDRRVVLGDERDSAAIAPTAVRVGWQQNTLAFLPGLEALGKRCVHPL